MTSADPLLWLPWLPWPVLWACTLFAWVVFQSAAETMFPPDLQSVNRHAGGSGDPRTTMRE